MSGRIAWRYGFADAPKAGTIVMAAVPSQLSPLAPTPRDLEEAPTQPRLRAAFLARRGVARRLAAARLGVDPAEVVIGHAGSGAPRILAPEAGLRISMSGRDDFCAVALAEAPVGVDMEPLVPPAEPAWAVLHADERRALAGLEEGARHVAFLRIWTAKEAYLKALGEGLARELGGIEVIARSGGEKRGAFTLRDVRGAPPLCGEWARTTLGGQDFIVACVRLDPGGSG